MMNQLLRRSILGLVLLIGISLCAVSCSKQEAPEAVSSQGSAALTHGVKARDFAPGQLQMHFTKHGYQFGAITEEEYLEDARKLLDAPVGTDLLEKVRENGDIEHYRPSTREFAVMTRTGRIRTYFITRPGYWERQ
ncbi:MAG: hypothetical protein HQL15_03290 [Candidatus Omnitrophica bacterium]|nr:hypothetical protein [Candidatus Omnitrophota bacterium]